MDFETSYAAFMALSRDYRGTLYDQARDAKAKEILDDELEAQWLAFCV